MSREDVHSAHPAHARRARTSRRVLFLKRSSSFSCGSTASVAASSRASSMKGSSATP